MPEIPLFPLGTVLFPDVLLPLRVFEDRYRELVRALIAGEVGEPRRFGVVAIRQGWEVGVNAVDALHEVGCAADLRQVTRHPDGQFDIVTVGSRRFRLRSVDSESRPYLMGEVDWLEEEPPGPEAETLAPGVGSRFESYVAAVAGARGGEVPEHELPDDPAELSYLVASTALLTLEDRQALLEEDSLVERLRAELRLLHRETTMLRTLRVVPAPLSELPAPTGLN